jgi:hypothetical protein
VTTRRSRDAGGKILAPGQTEGFDTLERTGEWCADAEQSKFFAAPVPWRGHRLSQSLLTKVSAAVGRNWFLAGPAVRNEGAHDGSVAEAKGSRPRSDVWLDIQRRTVTTLKYPHRVVFAFSSRPQLVLISSGDRRTVHKLPRKAEIKRDGGHDQVEPSVCQIVRNQTIRGRSPARKPRTATSA